MWQIFHRSIAFFEAASALDMPANKTTLAYESCKHKLFERQKV